MRNIKNFIILALSLVIIGYSGYSIYSLSVKPCKKTLKYEIGRFDTEFGISREQFKTYVEEAETVWEKALNRDTFAYESGADFKINLIYDERQLATVQKQKTESGLQAIENVFKQLDSRFYTYKKEYDSRVSMYEQSLAVFAERKEAYDKEVTYWNKRGGAPKEKFESLEAERVSLNVEADKLNTEALAINSMAKQLNVLLDERNAKASEYNRVAESYNRRYNEGLEFNQAEYTGKEINVYQFGDKRDLLLAISHELGHALGMDHTENPKSIMYYLTGINAETSMSLSSEDLAELNRVCGI